MRYPPSNARRWRLDFRGQLALLLAACLLAAWGAIAFELSALKARTERDTRRDLENLSQAFAEDANALVGTVDLSLLGLGALWMRNPENFRVSVSELLHHLEDEIIFQVAVTDARGRLVFSSVDPAARAIDLSDREHVRVHLENPASPDVFVGRPVKGRVSGHWSIQFSHALRTPDGRLQGVIVASVEPGYFARFYRKIDLGRQAEIVLVRADGTVLAHSPQDEAGDGMGLVLAGSPFGTERQAGVRGFYRRVSRIDGVDRFYAWRVLPGRGLIVVVGQAAEDVFGSYRRQRAAYLSGGALLSLLLLAIGYLMLAGARERALATVALAESEARWKFALEGSGEGVWDWDVDAQRARLSERGRAILQVRSETIPFTERAVAETVHPDDLPTVKAAMQAHLDGKTPAYAIEHRVLRSDGSWVWVLARGMVVKRAPDGRPLRVVGTISDVSERKARDEVIAHLAHHDVLTDLPNRALFADRLRQALLLARRDSGCLAVLYFDLDKFKPVNDSFGHQVGDQLLKAVAVRVRECLRESDTLARIGGDEFAVLLPDIGSRAGAVKVAENVLAALNRPFRVARHVLHISGSIGVVTYPSDGDDGEALLRRADAAMYRAKEAGRNRVHA